MGTRHERLFGTKASTPLQYALLAILSCILIQISLCLLTRRRPRRLFDSWSVTAVGVVCFATLLIRETFFPRQVFATCLVCAWSTRLAYFLYTRQYVAKDEVTAGEVLPRILWSFVCSLPCVLANEFQTHSDVFSPSEKLGFFLFALGLSMETLADRQKQAWHAANHNERPSKTSAEYPICTVGLWRYSRWPNYLGEVLVHFGVFFVVSSVLPPAVIILPILNTCMLYFGAYLKHERRRNATYGLYPLYSLYRTETSPWLLLPPALYARASFKCCETDDMGV